MGAADITGELLKEGTTSLSASALAESAARMGSTLSVSSGADETSLDMDVLSEYGPDAVKLLADVLQHPLLPESELARLKTNLLRRSQWPSHSRTNRIGSLPEADVRGSSVRFDAADGRDRQQDDNRRREEVLRRQLRAARAHLYVAGKFDVATVKKAIEAGFSGWAKGPQRLRMCRSRRRSGCWT